MMEECIMCVLYCLCWKGSGVNPGSAALSIDTAMPLTFSCEAILTTQIKITHSEAVAVLYGVPEMGGYALILGGVEADEEARWLTSRMQNW